jgi:hypothetical protein
MTKKLRGFNEQIREDLMTKKFNDKKFLMLV